MKALSIQQPWGWLIANGHKDIENRSWPTKFRGQFLIHAGKKYDGPFKEWDFPAIKRPNNFKMGGIIGVAEIVDCVIESDSPWFFGKFGFVIKNARPVPYMPVRGQLGFFDVDFPRYLLENKT